jgi:hypothetical protein
VAEEGRLKQALERFVQATLPQIDYFAQYPGTIISQNGQLFDFLPDSPAVPGLQNLAFYSGTPGVTLTVDTTQNPRAVLFFQNHDPAQPALSVFANPGLKTYALMAEESLSFIAPAVALGAAAGNAGLNPLILSTNYYGAENTWFAAISAAFAAILTYINATGSPGPPLTALDTALGTTFTAATTAYTTAAGIPAGTPGAFQSAITSTV